MQILGVSASRGKAKVTADCAGGDATLRADGVTCNDGSWNRSMWRVFNIKGKLEHNTPRAHVFGTRKPRLVMGCQVESS